MLFPKQKQDRIFFAKTILFVGLSVILLLGCRSEKRPDGFPKIYPVTLEVHNEGKPVEGVLITLISQDQSVPWAVGGKTDASGKASLVTHGKYHGVPNGDYSVVMTKTDMDNYHEFISGPDETNPRSAANNKSFKIYSLIDTKYTDVKTTDLVLNVDGKKVNQTFDLGPAVKVLISTYKPGSL